MTPPKRVRYPRPWMNPDARRAPADALLAPQRPDVPNPFLPFEPNSMTVEGPRMPEVRPPTRAEQIRTLLTSLSDYPPVLGRGLAEAPLTIARDVATSKTPDEVIHALTGIGLSTDPNSRARRPSDARGGRFGQAASIAALAVPELAAMRGLSIEERAMTQGLRNAERFASGAKAARPTIEALAEHIDPLSVPAFERAGGRTRPFGNLMTYKPGEFNPTLPSAIQAGLDAGGFTIDRTGKPFSGSGYMIADHNLTRKLAPGDPNAIVRFLAEPRVQAELGQPGRYIGGWRDPESGQIEINVTRGTPDRVEAIRVARAGKQKAIGRFESGNYTGDMPVPVGRETLTGPALRIGGKTYSDAFPRAHVHVLGQAEDALYDRALPANQRSRPYYDALGNMTPSDEGFMARDEAGNTNFVGREEAAQIHDQPITRFERTRRSPTALHAFDVQTPATTAPAILDLSPRYRALADALLPDEQRYLTKRTMPAFEAAGEALPDDEIFGAGALAGKDKLGWYANSANALSETFGPDAPRFAALLAALSPQRPVSENLRSALDLWDVWNHMGRPQDSETITRMMHDVARKHEGGGELPARIGNSVRALTTEDPSQLALSGPKVFNFHRNLIGDAQRVTLDTWMSRLGGLRGQSGLSRSVRGFGQPSPTYLAYSGRVRQTADYLSRITGHKWSPAEVQETLWSWGKALTETAEPLMRGQHPSQMDLMGPLSNFSQAIPLVSRDKIRGVPDFATLMNEAPFSESIQNQGLPLPIARSTIPPSGLPDADPLGLDILAGNLQGSFLRNERGALGGKRTLLRIENERGKGPYHDMRWMEDAGATDAPSTNQPMMTAPEWNDMNYTEAADHHVFGFRDLAQMRRWFSPEDLQALANHGFRVQPYEVPQHIYDRAQAVFDREQARRANATPLTPHADPMIPQMQDEGNAALPMLGLSGGAALGGLTLWQLLQNAQRTK